MYRSTVSRLVTVVLRKLYVLFDIEFNLLVRNYIVYKVTNRISNIPPLIFASVAPTSRPRVDNGFFLHATKAIIGKI